MTEQKMTQMIMERVNEMKSSPKVQKIMLAFENDNDAYNWLIKAAIATLWGINKV